MPTEDETKAMQKALAPVHAEMAERINGKTINQRFERLGLIRPNNPAHSSPVETQNLASLPFP